MVAQSIEHSISDSSKITLIGLVTFPTLFSQFQVLFFIQSQSELPSSHNIWGIISLNIDNVYQIHALCTWISLFNDENAFIGANVWLVVWKIDITQM